MALPSQFRSSTTWVRLFGPVPQSPLHVPFSGWPNCAYALLATATKAIVVTNRTNRAIYESFPFEPRAPSPESVRGSLGVERQVLREKRQHARLDAFVHLIGVVAVVL